MSGASYFSIRGANEERVLFRIRSDQAGAAIFQIKDMHLVNTLQVNIAVAQMSGQVCQDLLFFGEE